MRRLICRLNNINYQPFTRYNVPAHSGWCPVSSVRGVLLLPLQIQDQCHPSMKYNWDLHSLGSEDWHRLYCVHSLYVMRVASEEIRFIKLHFTPFVTGFTGFIISLVQDNGLLHRYNFALSIF
jgi:hypothetical protein